MLRVGLTGGLSCGKTTVAKTMQARGAFVLQADLLAHELMQPGQPVYERVVKHFGRAIVNDIDGKINRAKLADAAFGSGRIKELNAIVHPAVIERQQRWMEKVAQRHPEGIAVVEAALIVEAGIQERFDKLIVVTCSRKQKVERFTARTVKDRESVKQIAAARREAERRMAAQITDEEKVKMADYVIDNSGDLESIEQQVDRIMNELKSIARMRAQNKKPIS